MAKTKPNFDIVALSIITDEAVDLIAKRLRKVGVKITPEDELDIVVELTEILDRYVASQYMGESSFVETAISSSNVVPFQPTA